MDKDNLEEVIRLLKGYNYIDKGYCYIKGNKRCHLIWNLYNPDNQIKLKDGFVIHHKNEDKTCDEIWNLEKLLKKEHTKLHRLGKSASFTTRKKMSDVRQGDLHPRGMLGKSHTVETRKRMSLNTDSEGEKNSMCKTTKNVVLEIRELWSMGVYKIRELANKFGIPYSRVFDIVRRNTWKHI